MSAFSRLFSMPGTGAMDSAIAGEGAVAGTAGKVYSQLPDLISSIKSLYTPGSPLFQSLNTQGGAASQLLAGQLNNMGLAGSSFAGNKMAGFDAGMVGQNQNLAQQGQSILAQLISGAGSTAMGANQLMGQAGAQEASAAGQGLGALGSVVGNIAGGGIPGLEILQRLFKGGAGAGAKVDPWATGGFVPNLG